MLRVDWDLAWVQLEPILRSYQQLLASRASAMSSGVSTRNASPAIDFGATLTFVRDPLRDEHPVLVVTVSCHPAVAHLGADGLPVAGTGDDRVLRVEIERGNGQEIDALMVVKRPAELSDADVAAFISGVDAFLSDRLDVMGRVLTENAS